MKSLFKELDKEKNNKVIFKSEDYQYFNENKNILKSNTFFNHYLEAKDSFDIIKANIIIEGLKNKEIIDDIIYKEYKLKDELKIEEIKSRIKEKCLDLPCLKLDEYKVFFPFFNQTTNFVYSNNNEKLLENPYKNIMEDYSSFLIDPFETYGANLFDSSFTHLVKVNEDNFTIAFYSYFLSAILIINKQGSLDNIIYLFDKHIKRPNKSRVIERIKPVIEAYYNCNLNEFVYLLFNNELISYKVFKNICKIKNI